jgi:hypothetical protein
MIEQQAAREGRRSSRTKERTKKEYEEAGDP